MIKAKMFRVFGLVRGEGPEVILAGHGTAPSLVLQTYSRSAPDRSPGYRRGRATVASDFSGSGAARIVFIHRYPSSRQHFHQLAAITLMCEHSTTFLKIYI